MVLLTLAAWSSSAILPPLLALGLLALLIRAGRLNRWLTLAALAPPAGAPDPFWARLWRRRGEQLRTANLLATWPGEPEVSGPASRVILVAHSDSKSQGMSLLARMALFLVLGVATFAFVLLGLLRVVVPAVTAAAALAGLAALLAGLPLVFLFLAGPGNASPGANDNASGLGTVLHLAEVLAPPPPGVAVDVLITGAEEHGLLGALHFVRTGGAPLRSAAGSSVFVLNFDGVGVAGRLAVAGGRPGSALVALVQQAAAGLGLGLGRVPLVGALYDHIPFGEAGFDALTLAVMGPAARLVHTPRDRPETLVSEGFRQAGEVGLGVVLALATGPAPESPTTSGPAGGG
jgi:hypothetical protein